MTREQLLEHHIELCKDAYELMQAKNHDYAASADPFKNFRRHGLHGILVRLDDKLCRLDSFVEKGELKVKDESVRDTVLDIINYALLFDGLRLALGKFDVKAS